LNLMLAAPYRTLILLLFHLFKDHVNLWIHAAHPLCFVLLPTCYHGEDVSTIRISLDITKIAAIIVVKEVANL